MYIYIKITTHKSYSQQYAERNRLRNKINELQKKKETFSVLGGG